MKINKFVNDADKPFHSNAYAEAANGSSMGASSTQSFQQRYRIDQNRRMVQRYRDSSVANAGHLREELNRRMDTPESKDEKHKYKFTRQRFNAGDSSAAPGATGSKPLQVPKRSFSEPQPRKYNPFS